MAGEKGCKFQDKYGISNIFLDSQHLYITNVPTCGNNKLKLTRRVMLISLMYCNEREFEEFCINHVTSQYVVNDEHKLWK